MTQVKTSAYSSWEQIADLSIEIDNNQKYGVHAGVNAFRIN